MSGNGYELSADSMRCERRLSKKLQKLRQSVFTFGGLVESKFMGLVLSAFVPFGCRIETVTEISTSNITARLRVSLSNVMGTFTLIGGAHSLLFIIKRLKFEVMRRNTKIKALTD